MRILFCNIAYLDYYQGLANEKRRPNNGGSYVKETGDGGESCNFKSREWQVENGAPADGRYCFGYAIVQGTDVEAQLHIEKIEGCAGAAREPYVDDVLVVYCATHPAHKFTTVVGWYRHARRYMEDMCFGDDEDDWQFYNAVAKAEDCVLLPTSQRSRITKWQAPRRNKGRTYGFGRSNIWFAQNTDNNPDLDKYLDKIQNQILNYDGENWRDKINGDMLR